MDRICKSPRTKRSPMEDVHDDVNRFIKSVENSTRKILQENVNRRKKKITSSSYSPLEPRSSVNSHSSLTNEDGHTDNIEMYEDSKEMKQDIAVVKAFSTNKDSKYTEKGGELSKAQWHKATKELIHKSDGEKSASPELSSSTLRSKYRCIPNNNNATAVIKSSDDHSNSPFEPTVRATLDQEKSLAVEKHPIYTLLQSHIRKENEKLRKLDEEVIKMRAASVLDRHAEWSSKIKSLGDDMFKEKKKISLNVEEEKALFELEMEREGMCKSRSEPSTPSIMQHEIHFDMEGIPDTFEPQQVPAPRIEKPNEKLYRIAPEIWPLIVCEPVSTRGSSIDDNSILVSIHRVHERTSYNIHQKCFVYGEQPFWIVELYHQADCSEEFYFSKESEMIPMIASLSKGDDTLTRGDKVLVHSEFSDMQNYHTQKTIFVQTYSMKTVAFIQLNIKCSICSTSEDETKNSEILCTQIDIPVFEIIIRLKKHNTWRAMEENPWYKSSNENPMWRQLMHLIEIDLEKSMERKEVVWRWTDEDGMDPDSMKSHDQKMTASAWNQPSVPPLNEVYLSTVNQAYNYIFHLCETSLCKSEIYNKLRHDVVDSVDQRLRFQTIWNERNEGYPPLALRRMGLNRIYSETLLQGSCVIETLHFPNPMNDKKGFEDESENEIQATVVATFDRDNESTNPPTVSISVAFDTPFVGPACVESDYEYVLPPPASPLPLDDSALKIMGEKGPILVPFQSAFENHEPSTIIVLDPAGEDGINKTKYHKDSRRPLPTFNEQNFRVKCFAHPMEIEEEPYVAQPFGISKNAVTPNKTTVHPPIHWHSEEICTSVLSRERTPRELYDLLMKDMPDRLVPTLNDPLLATVRFKGYKVGSVEFAPKQEFLQKERERAELEEQKRKDKLLACKMEAAQKLVEQREEKERLDILEECSKNDHLIHEKQDPSRSEIPMSPNTLPTNDEEKIVCNEKDAQELIHSLKKGRIMTCPDPQTFKSVCKPKIIGMIDPSTLPEERRCNMNLLRVKPSTKFISNVLEDRIQMARARDENKRYQEMILNASQKDALEHILRIPMTDTDRSMKGTVGMQSIDREILHSEAITANTNRIQHPDIMEEYKNLSIAEKEYQAIMAVKALNFTVLEELLDGCALDVETQDEFGNTLFILACQQASKKMAKFLLRRGAQLDAQNHTGNTALHYLYEYDHLELADYLLGKGADDTLLNAHGFTCYEGVTPETKNL